MEELLSIGEFASQSGLTAKMLRSYASVGLLVPAAVDPSSGYRYYSTEQLHRARVVALLRRAGVSVDDILDFFERPEESHLERWDAEIVTSSASRRQALAEAAALTTGRGSFASCSTDPAKENQMGVAWVPGKATGCGERETNEDAVLIDDALYAVADGIGGLPHGEVASCLALDTLSSAFRPDGSVSDLLHACQRANRAVWERSCETGAQMGTTLLAVAETRDGGTVVLHVGDSRAYRHRNRRLNQMTLDHTVVAESMSAGDIAEEDVAHHPYRYVLTRAIGVAPEVEADYAGLSCKPGDRLLLCTDGLYKALPIADMDEILISESDPQGSAERLVKSAVDRGAEDNVTAVVVDAR